MRDARFDRLADRVLDGTASEPERLETERRLEREPEARARYQELAETFETLRSVPRPEPPAELHGAILDAVRLQASPPPIRDRFWRSRLQPPSLVRLAYAGAGFMAGAAITLAFAAALFRGAWNDGQASGSMASPDATHPPIRRSLQLPGVAVTAEASRQGDRLRLRLKATAERAARILVTFDPEGMRLSGMARPGARGSVDLADGRAILTGRGDLSMDLEWSVVAREPAPLGIEAAAGNERSALRLDVNPPPRGSPRQE